MGVQSGQGRTGRRNRRVRASQTGNFRSLGRIGRERLGSLGQGHRLPKRVERREIAAASRNPCRTARGNRCVMALRPDLLVQQAERNADGQQSESKPKRSHRPSRKGLERIHYPFTIFAVKGKHLHFRWERKVTSSTAEGRPSLRAEAARRVVSNPSPGQQKSGTENAGIWRSDDEHPPRCPRTNA
jgi:hypothetical protein